ncbi:MAG: tetratricopeptide repeat protein [Bacteroidota bacterium]
MKRPSRAPVKEKQQDLSRERQVLKENSAKQQQQDKLVLMLAFIVAAVAFTLYINTFGHKYALDDYSLILENKSTQKGFAGIGEILKTSYRYGYIMSDDELYRPLSKVIFAIEWQLSPKNPFIGHFLNVLLYALTGFLMMIVLRKYFQSVTLAFIASLLFIAHPIHTEVVANIKSLDEILSLLFNLLTLNCIYNYGKNSKASQLILAFVFFFLAMLSKESSVTYLAVFVAAWYFFMKESWSQFFKVGGSILAAFLVFMLIRKSIVGGVVSLSPSAADNLIVSAPDAAHHFATAVYIFGLYMLKLVFPHPLVFDYSISQIPIVGMSDWRFLLTIAVLVTAFIFALKNFTKRPVWIFGFISFLAVASVASNIFITIGTSMGERLMYGPSLGFCILVAGLISKAGFNESAVTVKEHLQSNKKIYMPLALVILAFSVKAITRNPVWKDNYSLYSNDVHLSPNSTRTHYYLGNLLIKDEMTAGKTQLQKDSILKEGIKELEKSVAIFPGFTDAWNQMGVAYWRLKNFEKAKNSYESALKCNPNDATVHSNIGTILFETGNYPEALKAFTKATQINPNYGDAFLNLGSVYGMMKQFDLAVPAFERCIAIDRNNATAWYYLGITYQSLGNTAKAQECFAQNERLKNAK